MGKGNLFRRGARGARKAATFALAALSLMALVPAGSLAASSTATLGVRGGALSVSAAPGSDIATGRTYSPLLMLTDARGTGVGWHLTVSMQAGERSATRPAATVEGVTLECAAGSSCTEPHNSISYPQSIADGAEPTMFLNAAGGTGLGRFAIRPVFGVDSAKSSYTFTVSAVSGP